MSHLVHAACGCDFFLSFSSFDPKVLRIVHTLKQYLEKNKVTFYCIDSCAYDHNYTESLLLQSIRSKIFLFFIDRFSLESDLFLYTYQYAKFYRKTNCLPVLVPVLCEQSFNETSSNLAASLADGCLLNFQISQVESMENFLTSLRDSIHDLVPISSHNNSVRHDDRFRPKNSAEEAFMNKMKSQEGHLMKKMLISSINIKSLFPAQKIISCLSIPHSSLKCHIDTMLSADFHLSWLDTVLINKINYFSLLWTSNDPNGTKTRAARPPPYLIFYDLNPAQLESICSEHTKNNWSLELIDSYIKHKNPILLKKRRQTRTSASKKSTEEIQYFCQFKYCPDTTPNQLKHSVIDTRFGQVYGQACGALKDKLLIPLRHTRVSMNVNVVNNVHFYHSLLVRSINVEEKSCYEKSRILDENDSVIVDNVYQVRENLSDQDLMQVYEELSRSNWRMIDLKAYKDKNFDVKFSTIWTSLESFREGTSLLFVGITQCELDQVAHKLNAKRLYPKLVVNYGYLNIKHEHVYVVYFTQE